MGVPGHILYSFRGHFGTSRAEQLDIWSCNIRVSKQTAGAPDVTVDPALAADAAADWATFMRGPNVPMGTNTFFDFVRMYEIGTDGKAIGEIAEAEPPDLSLATGGFGAAAPFQSAIVVTLDTVTRAKPRYGRFFVPCTAAAVGSNGRLLTSLHTGLRDAAVQLVKDLNNRPGFDSTEQGHQVSVVSGVAGGAIKPVRLVRVGDVVDTMRSRRSALTESYISGEIAVN